MASVKLNVRNPHHKNAKNANTMLKAKPVAMTKSVCTKPFVMWPDTAPTMVPKLLITRIAPTVNKQPYTLRRPMAMTTVQVSTSKHCSPKRKSVPDVFAKVSLNDSGVVRNPAITMSTDTLNRKSSRLFPQLTSRNSSKTARSGVARKNDAGAPATSLNVRANPDAAEKSRVHTNTPWNIGKNAAGSVSFRSSTESPAPMMLSTRPAPRAAQSATPTWTAVIKTIATKGVPAALLPRSSTLAMNSPSATAKLTCLLD